MDIKRTNQKYVIEEEIARLESGCISPVMAAVLAWSTVRAGKVISRFATAANSIKNREYVLESAGMSACDLSEQQLNRVVAAFEAQSICEVPAYEALLACCDHDVYSLQDGAGAVFSDMMTAMYGGLHLSITQEHDVSALVAAYDTERRAFRMINRSSGELQYMPILSISCEMPVNRFEGLLFSLGIPVSSIIAKAV